MKCWFCDTQHNEGHEMSTEEILNAALQYPARHVVITGGEPLLQLSQELTEKLHEAGYFIQIETNGTLPLPEGVKIDWITCSPKGNVKGNNHSPILLQHIDELKVVYEGLEQDLNVWNDVQAQEYRLQPCDVKDEERNKSIVEATINFILKHPKWHLSLQTHKMLDIM